MRMRNKGLYLTDIGISGGISVVVTGLNGNTDFGGFPVGYLLVVASGVAASDVTSENMWDYAVTTLALDHTEDLAGDLSYSTVVFGDLKTSSFDDVKILYQATDGSFVELTKASLAASELE